MKRLIGLLFCFGFLLFAGAPDTQAQTQAGTVPVLSTDYQAPCIALEQPVINIGVTQNRFTELFAKARYAFDKQVPPGIDMVKLREASGLAVKKANEALYNRYRLVPDCPVQYIHYGRYSYYWIYFTRHTLNYSQPPNSYNL